MPAEELSPALQAAVLSLRVDSVTAEVVSKLRSAGVRPILLKGPSIAAWLYADGTPRPYGDTDLLVESEALPSTSRALRAAGFREQPAVSSYTWFRRSDGSFVDIHDTLFSAEAPREEAWRTLSEGTETMSVGGLDVEVLSRPARLLYVALHAAQHESDGFKQPLRDLERALHHADEKYWHEAAALAKRLRATPTFAAGLRLHPDGAGLAVRLDLPHDRPLMLSLREQGGRSTRGNARAARDRARPRRPTATARSATRAPARLHAVAISDAWRGGGEWACAPRSVASVVDSRPTAGSGHRLAPRTAHLQ